MPKNSDEKLSKADRTSERQTEKILTNSRKNRSFIDNVLESNDENAIKKLFEEYFYLHAEKYKDNRITWNDLRFITNEILQRNNDELILSEATNLFYQMYQLQFSRSLTPKQENKNLCLKKAKSEQELSPKSKPHSTLKDNKKMRNE